MEFTDYLWAKIVVLGFIAFVMGLLGFTGRSRQDRRDTPPG